MRNHRQQYNWEILFIASSGIPWPITETVPLTWIINLLKCQWCIRISLGFVTLPGVWWLRRLPIFRRTRDAVKVDIEEKHFELLQFLSESHLC
jgi:hypothetical protein